MPQEQGFFDKVSKVIADGYSDVRVKFEEAVWGRVVNERDTQTGRNGRKRGNRSRKFPSAALNAPSTLDRPATRCRTTPTTDLRQWNAS